MRVNWENKEFKLKKGSKSPRDLTFYELGASLGRLQVEYGGVESVESLVLVLEGFYTLIVDEGLNDI